MFGMRKMPDRNRCAFDIIAEILRELREPKGKTNIMSRCNMSFTQSGHYLSLMRSNDLVQMDATAGKVTYQRTDAGLEFLARYKKLVVLFDPLSAIFFGSKSPSF